MRKGSIPEKSVFLILAVCFSVLPAFAETIELVTYYPAPGGGNVQTDRLRASRGTVGDAYSLTNPADAVLTEGTLLVADRLGIGPVFGTTPPAGALHVVGADDTLDRVLFMPGADTPAAGRPDIRVGIGTQNPQAMLDIQHPQDAAYVRVMGTGDATNFSGLELRSDETVDKIWQIVHKQAAGLNDLHVNYFDGAAWSTKMAIQPGGNVGIGTGNPVDKLHVLGNGNVRVRLTGTDSTTQFVQYPTNGGAYWDMGTVGQNTYFRTSNASVLDTTAMLIQSNGNVGIGTDTPAAALQVTRRSGGDAAIRIHSGTPGGFQGNARLELRGEWGEQGDNQYIEGFNLNYDNHGNVNFDQLYSGGDMVFRMRVAYTPTLAMTIHPDGTVIGNFVSSSDVTQKTQIQPLTGALERVTALRGITYRWKDKTLNQGKQIGFSAQEVEKVFPEVVRTFPDGLKTVAYDHLTAALVEAVKEQQREIEKLNERVRELEERATSSR